MSTKLILTTGRRKTSIARAKLVSGKGNIIINGKNLSDYFNRETLVEKAVQPLKITDSMTKYDITINVHGGGLAGQSGAACLAIARALLIVDPNNKMPLKKTHLLTRDSRMKERKKYGQRGARAKFQFSKR